MNITHLMDSNEEAAQEKPGAQLAAQRILKDYSPEYVASKLHLRVRIIELLEADDYQNMPEAVFIKGYLRAYAKLLGVPPEPLLEAFNQRYAGEKKSEKALWQSRRQSNRSEHAVRWITILFSLAVLVAVGMWWESNRENDPMVGVGARFSQEAVSPAHHEVRLTDLSKMRSLLSAAKQPAQGTTGD